MDSGYESITRRYTPHTRELIFYVVTETKKESPIIPSYPHLQLVVNKPVHLKKPRGVRS